MLDPQPMASWELQEYLSQERLIGDTHKLLFEESHPDERFWQERMRSELEREERNSPQQLQKRTVEDYLSHSRDEPRGNDLQ